MSSYSRVRSDILQEIKDNERQKDVAKRRNEDAVVQYHQKAIDKMYQELRLAK